MRTAVFILTITLAAFLSTTDFAGAEDKVRVAISNFSASYISMHIAQKRGFYAEEGMTVEVILMAGLTSTRALIGNSVEFGSASNPTAAVQGAKLKILMVFNDKPPGEFMAQPGIKNVGELRGKRVGGSTVGSLDYGWLKEVLPKFGLQLEKDVNFVPVGSTSTRFMALRGGTIDAASLSPPSSLMAQSLGYSTLFRFADHLEDIQASIVGTDDRLARQAKPSGRHRGDHGVHSPERPRPDSARLRRSYENYRARRHDPGKAPAHRYRPQQTIHRRNARRPPRRDL